MTEPSILPVVKYEARLIAPAWDDYQVLELDEVALRVRSFEFSENAGEPFVLEITLLSDDASFDANRLHGADFHLHMVRDDPGNPGIYDGRSLHGVVTRAVYVGAFADAYQIQLFVVPAFALLDAAPRSRIFQDKTVVEIFEQVAGEFLQPRGRAIDTTWLRGTYAARDYCVQFGESDLQFLHRILAEEGISYIFDHQGEETQHETLVLIDANEVFQSTQKTVDPEAGSTPQHVPLASGSGELEHVETVRGFEATRAVYAALQDVEQWDWKTDPISNLRSQVTVKGQHAPWQVGEGYHHGGRRLQEGELGTSAHLDNSKGVAMRHAQGRALRAEIFDVGSNVLGMTPLRTFDLDGHPDSDLNRTYYCIGVRHTADCPQVHLGGGGHDGGGLHHGANYTNTARCADLEQPFQPSVPRRPRVYGPQTAVVVGPPGEEIHTDQFGRIQVRMHWDREQRDLADGTTCWLRVAQTWAGPGFGSVFIPRVGMEVLVAFLDGDPDRPICVGCVYNGQNMPPYGLPGEKTKSTIKSNSTPGGGGFNELRFEDAAGSEEIFMHAQKDLNEKVGNAHTTTVGANQTIDIGTHRTVSVGASQNTTITGAQNITVKGKGAGDMPPPDPVRTVTVDGAIVETATKTITIEGQGTNVRIICGTSPMSTIDMTPNSITLTAGDGASLTLGSGVALASASANSLACDPAGSFNMDAAGVLQMVSIKGSSVKFDEDVKMESSGSTVVTLTDELAMAAGTGATATLNKDITMEGETLTSESRKGGTLEITGDVKAEGTTVKLESWASSLELTAKSLKSTAATIALEAAAEMALASANIKLN